VTRDEHYIAEGQAHTNGCVRVFAAIGQPSGRRVIIKAAPREDPAAARLRDEYRIASRVRHAGVVRTRELRSEGDDVQLVLEDAQGEPILEWFAAHRAGPGTSGHVAEVFARLAVALATVHSEGVLHLDVSPGNVLVAPHGQPVLIDFGQAVDSDSASPAQGGGTPGYAAPELDRWEAPGEPSDWFSFGKLLQAALDLAPPLDPMADVELRALSSAMLTSEPAQRPVAREVIDRLGKLTASARRYRERLPFMGRRLELDELSRAFARTLQQRTPSLVCISGDAGYGKTRLVREFLRHRRDSATVLEHACLPDRKEDAWLFEGIASSLAAQLDQWNVGLRLEPGIAPVIAVFEPLRRFLEQTEGPARATATGFERIRAEMALLALLEKQFRPAPLILWLDDVQWAEDDALRDFVTALNQVTRGALMVVLSYRPHEQVRHALARARRTLELHLSPVDPSAATDLTDAALRAACVRALRDSQGIPFLAELAFNGDALGTLIHQLPVHARDVLSCLSLAGAMTYRELAAVLLDANLEDQLGTLQDQRLITRHVRDGHYEDVITTSHQLISEACIVATSPASRKALHDRIAGALMRLEPIDWIRIQHHTARGAALHPRRGWALAAARQARRGARHDVEVIVLRDLLAATSLGSARRRVVHRRIAIALGRCARATDAADEYRRAAADATRDDLRVCDLSDGALALLRAGQLDEAFAVFELANGTEARFSADLQTLFAEIQATLTRLHGMAFPEEGPHTVAPGSTGHRHLRTQLSIARGLLCCDMVRGTNFVIRCFADAVEALHLDIAAECGAVLLSGILQVMGPANEPLIPRVEQFVDRFLPAPSGLMTALRDYARGQSLLMVGQFAAARTPLQRAMDQIEAAGDERHSWERNSVLTCLLRCIEEAGEIEHVNRLATEHFRYSVATDDLWGQVLARGYLAVAARRMGELEEAEAYLDANAEVYSSRFYAMQATYDHRTRALIQLGRHHGSNAALASSAARKTAAAYGLTTNQLVRFDLLKLQKLTLSFVAQMRPSDEQARQELEDSERRLAEFKNRSGFLTPDVPET
jgi:serine/threonine protein kinase